MRTTGTTAEGYKIVEMSNEEHVLLMRLKLADEGVDVISWHGSPTVIDEYDMTKPLQAVLAWMHLKSLANKVRHFADMVDNNLYGENNGQDG